MYAARDSAKAAEAEDNDNASIVADKFAKHAESTESGGCLSEMLRLARSEKGMAIDASELDANPWLLSFTNGTMDLHTGELRDHRRDDLITRIIEIDYDPGAQCPQFNRFMLQIFDEHYDLIEYIERLMGWSLTGDIRHHILPIFYGEGANGKSTLLDVVQHIMGEYACPAAESLLTTRTGDEHPTELARLAGKRLVVASETDEAKKLRIGLVKRLTGDEWITGRFMRRDYFTFRRTHKTILCTNNKPRIAEDPRAIWRRIKLTPFTVQIPEAEQDKALPDKLKAEAPGIVARLVAVCQRWIADGYDLAEPEAVRAATEDYRHDEVNLADFIEQRCILVQGTTATRHEIWAEYSKWASDTGERHPLGRRSLFDRLRKLEGVEEGYSQATGKTQRMLKGIGLALRGSYQHAV